jgi:hypothetical protein
MKKKEDLDKARQRYAESAREQLASWLAGKPVHNPHSPVVDFTDKDGKVVSSKVLDGNGECCPDFSCCRPELLWPTKMRESFILASPEKRDEMLRTSVVEAISRMVPEEKVYVAGKNLEESN